MEVNTPRGQSIYSDTNSSKETLVYSDVFSIAYVNHVQILANNPTWAEQVKLGKTKGLALSYVFLKEGEIELANKANTTEPMLNSYEMVINDMCSPQGLESLAIPYLVNQPVNLQL